MDKIIDKIMENLFSQTGLAGLLMAAAIVYLARELAKERKDHAKTREKLDTLSEKSITSSVQATEALAAMRNILEMIRGLLTGRPA